jgi:signal transduction histidine kinase
VACFTITVIYGYTSADPTISRPTVLWLASAFATYSSAAYLIWRHLVPTLESLRFHTLVCVVDFVFVVTLLALTGGVESPLSRGLYIWVAIAATMFGYRGGSAASLVAAAAFITIEAQQAWVLNGWERAFYLGGFLVHGPFVGAIASLQRSKTVALEETHRRLAEAHEYVKAHQSRAIETEKFATIGLVGASLAHEINNPIMGMYACVRGLRKSTASEERRTLYLDTIDDAIDRISSSVQAVLTYTRADRRPAQWTKVHDVVDASVRLVRSVASTADVRFVIDTARVEVVWAPRGQLEQALVNLLLNAIYASPVAGVIRIVAHKTEAEVRITVCDQGDGFEEGIIDRALEPFVTTKPEGSGTGLGLSVTDGLMRGLGGQLTLHNGEEGAVVTLTIPRHDTMREDIS